MKKKITIATTIILVIALILICFNTWVGYVKIFYPKEMTAEHCIQNYNYADPNLTFLSCAFDCPDIRGIHAGVYYLFKAIRGVPVDDYLVVRNFSIFDKRDYYIVVKNRSMDRKELEILTKEVKSIEVYQRKFVDKYIDEHMLGKKCYDKRIALLTDDQSQALMEHIKTCFEAKDYRITANESIKQYRTLKDNISLRVHFSEYKNLVWDAVIIQNEGKYEVLMYYIDPYFLNSEEADNNLYGQFENEKIWVQIAITLPDEIAELISV